MDAPTPVNKCSDDLEFDHNVTWREFKDAIDKMLADGGVSPDVPIWYIDISYPWRFVTGVNDEGLSVA